MTLQYGPSNINLNGLVLYLDAANDRSYPTSGTTWTDISGFGSNGTLTNGPTFNSGNAGSIVFDGSNDFVNVTPFSSNFPSGSAARTMCAMFRATTVAGGREIFGIGANTGGGTRSALWIDATRGIGIESQVPLVLTTDWPGINNWVYLCVVIPSTNIFSSLIYVNGSLVSSTNYGTDLTLNTATTAATIGTVPTATSAHMFSGNISSIKLYNRALTADEVLSNFNAIRGRYGI